PSTLPSVMVDLPVNELVVSPVSLLPSCLKVKVLSIAPFGPSAVAFQLPLMSAARALKANSAISAGSHFMLAVPFPQLSVYNAPDAPFSPTSGLEIGRASCRERV